MLRKLSLFAMCSMAAIGHAHANTEDATGKASYYADRFTGKPTASGERYQPTKLTAAHKHLPLGTRVKVTNLRNKRSVIVRINDRGRLGRGRIIDLSHRAAEEIGMLRSGIAPVRVMVLK